MELSVSDIETILGTLVFDGKVERLTGEEGGATYRVVRPLLHGCGLMRVPCGVCPVRITSPTVL